MGFAGSTVPIKLVPVTVEGEQSVQSIGPLVALGSVSELGIEREKCVMAEEFYWRS